MNGKKALLATTLSKLKLNVFFRNVRRLFVEDVRIIAYHRICEIDEYNDKELVSASCKEFEKQVIYIKKHYNAISFSELIECIRNKSSFPKNALIITFDDGFADNYINAFPILKKHQLSATFFISTGYIDTKETFWFNLLSRLVKTNAGGVFNIENSEFCISNDLKEQEILLLDLLVLLKNRPNLKRLEILNDLTSQLSNRGPCDPLSLPMTWENIKEMGKYKIEFGSHTVTHPILSQLTEQELENEIRTSKKDLEEHLGRKIQTISYPEGMEYAYNKKVIDIVDKAGYELGCSYIPGVNKLDSLELFQLKRMHVERYVNFDLFRSMLAMPEIFGK